MRAASCFPTLLLLLTVLLLPVLLLLLPVKHLLLVLYLLQRVFTVVGQGQGRQQPSHFWTVWRAR